MTHEETIWHAACQLLSRAWSRNDATFPSMSTVDHISKGSDARLITNSGTCWFEIFWTLNWLPKLLTTFSTQYKQTINNWLYLTFEVAWGAGLIDGSWGGNIATFMQETYKQRLRRRKFTKHRRTGFVRNLEGWQLEWAHTLTNSVHFWKKKLKFVDTSLQNLQEFAKLK